MKVNNDLNASSRSRFEAMLFALCKNEENGKASMRFFLDEIRRTGIRPFKDPRLKLVIEKLREFKHKPNASLESLNLEYEQFCQVLAGNLPLLVKIFRNDLVIPEFQTFCDSVTTLYNNLKDNFDGECATYIPQLARVPKDKWGISICTVDGQRFSIGDVHDKFTIQSTSKPITYALTLEELGTEIVHRYQGREPSGRMFNEIVLDHNNQPHNPMVNSGAIMSASILLQLVKPEMNMAQKYDYVFEFFKKMAGGEYLGFNNSVFLSERDSADRNFALAYFLRENLCFPPGDVNIPNILDFYFQTCSLEMTAESECVIAATLANGGVCPITGERILRPASVRNVLSLMLSCGLYNYSGDFAFKVGLPGKSGVAGAIILVIPNVMGICFWAPPLDELGNSVRGVNFCEEFVRLYNFHKVTGELSASPTSLVDPTRNKYEIASQVIIHILMAANAGDETPLKCAFQQGVNMNMGDYDGRTALHLASAEGHLRCVRFLLDVCKVKHDCKDRWGQTPLTEAIQFKHTKVAAILKRYDRTRQMKERKGKLPLVNEQHGEALWRSMVEKKFTKEHPQPPPLKFDKANLDKKDKNQNSDDNPPHPSNDVIKGLEKLNVDSAKNPPRPKLNSERSEGGFGHGDLEMVQEHDERETETSSEAQSEDADDEREMSKAASVIQGKFRERLQRRSMADITNNGNDSGRVMRQDNSGKNGGCSSPTSDDSGISPVQSPENIISQ